MCKFIFNDSYVATTITGRTYRLQGSCCRKNADLGTNTQSKKSKSKKDKDKKKKKKKDSKKDKKKKKKKKKDKSKGKDDRNLNDQCGK